jgi:molybdopterin synthase catalytic subunit
LSVEIRERPFDPWREVVRFQEGHPALLGKAGATAVFVGSMRDFNESQNVHTMTLEHYPGMTERHLEKICEDAGNRWALQEILVIHRVGALRSADPIVLVAVWSAHRAAAFEACASVMEALKSHAPFWKKEELDEGHRWVASNTPGTKVNGR